MDEEDEERSDIHKGEFYDKVSWITIPLLKGGSQSSLGKELISSHHKPYYSHILWDQ